MGKFRIQITLLFVCRRADANYLEFCRSCQMMNILSNLNACMKKMRRYRLTNRFFENVKLFAIMKNNFWDTRVQLSNHQKLIFPFHLILHSFFETKNCNHDLHHFCGFSYFVTQGCFVQYIFSCFLIIL